MTVFKLILLVIVLTLILFIIIGGFSLLVVAFMEGIELKDVRRWFGWKNGDDNGQHS